MGLGNEAGLVKVQIAHWLYAFTDKKIKLIITLRFLIEKFMYGIEKRMNVILVATDLPGWAFSLNRYNPNVQSLYTV